VKKKTIRQIARAHSSRTGKLNSFFEVEEQDGGKTHHDIGTHEDPQRNYYKNYGQTLGDLKTPLNVCVKSLKTCTVKFKIETVSHRINIVRFYIRIPTHKPSTTEICLQRHIRTCRHGFSNSRLCLIQQPQVSYAPFLEVLLQPMAVTEPQNHRHACQPKVVRRPDCRDERIRPRESPAEV
jgi:hypothetical protein